MSLNLRDKKRYGLFKADSSIGEVLIDISISGWGELIILTKNKKEICRVDTVDNNDNSIDYTTYEESDREINIDGIIVKKPFIRTLKRYK